MGTEPVIDSRYAASGPTSSESLFWLHNRFDKTFPSGWEEVAIERIYADWAAEDEREAEMPGNSSFLSRVFVTAVVLVAAAWIAMNWH